MKQLTTILFLLFASCSFGQMLTSYTVGEMTVVETKIDSTQKTQQDTSFLPPTKHVSKDDKSAKNAGYTVVVPKQSEYKLVVPKRTVTQVQKDSVAYNIQEQTVWVDNSENAFTHEINVAKHALKTERLTYEQMQYLQSLPYIK